jgi:glyceraldehyde 3-phosphate dehydrogenase
MTVRIAINGFGRIGRLVARAILERGDDNMELVAINDLADVQANALLFKYDSTHGRYAGEVVAGDDHIMVDGKKIAVTCERNPGDLPHKAMNIDIVFECTGFFQSKEACLPHLAAGAKRVLISAPAGGVDKTVVYGVNHDVLTSDDIVVSNASCTTNCLAPVAKVLHETVGIERGFMTTIHSYTNDQRILDQMHSDMRRARGGGVNMIPTTTGAARAVGLVLPELNGKLDGSSIRVPTPNVSLVDLVFTPSRDTTKEEINNALKAAAEGPMKGVLVYETLPLVSSDFNHQPASSTVDSLETTVMDGKLVRVVSWYDNEWGFSNRMIDTAKVMASFL